MKHLLSITDLSTETLTELVHAGLNLAKGAKDFFPLKGKVIGMYFQKPSTRTRTSFAVGGIRLGGSLIGYGSDDLQLVTGESLSDTGKVLGSYIDLLVIRTNESVQEMQELANGSDMAVINALSVNEHPTQAIADLITIREALGKLEDVHILYLGEGNNTAASLALAVSMTPNMRMTLATPEGYGLPDDTLEKINYFTRQNDSQVEQLHQVDLLPKHVDVVYTTRWESMGVLRAEQNWRRKFEPYRVTSTLMQEVAKSEGTFFLHDLPAIRGSEVASEVIDGSNSLVFRQAYHKLTSAMVTLTWCSGAKFS